MWTADNTVESRLWNLHGLAHKVIFEAEFSYAEATKSFDQFPLYDQLDDDTINQYRRNIAFFDFNNPSSTNASPAFFTPHHRLISSVRVRAITTADTIQEHMQFDEGSVAGSLGRVK